jgi:hypothetical protein
MSQDINALEIARNVKPRTVGAFIVSPSNQDCFNAADCIISQADCIASQRERIEALERQLAEATKDRQRLTSDEADFERGTWTFHSDADFRVGAGDYWIVPIRQLSEENSND